MLTPLYIIGAAVLIDLIIGEPPEFLHPVVWIGKTIGVLSRRAPEKNQRTYGLLISLLCIFFFAILSFALVFLSFYFHYLLGIVVSAYLLKSTISIRCFSSIAREIRGYLESDDLEKARLKLPWLVGRDTRNIPKEEMSSAVIESVAENWVDTILSPIFYFVLFSFLGLGVPVAIGYKVINTLDSMVGYKEMEVGFWAAKLDEAVNFIPARISMLFLFLGSLPTASAGRALGTCRRDHMKTESINSGYPMSTMAGALEVQLIKSNHYVLGAEMNEPKPRDISRALRVMWLSTLLLIIIACLALLGLGYLPNYWFE